MTDLKRVTVPNQLHEDDVTYLWRSDRRGRGGRASMDGVAAPRRGDPLAAPWGDIVETPMRILRRLFNFG